MKAEFSWRYGIIGICKDPPVFRIHPVPFVRITVGHVPDDLASEEAMIRQNDEIARELRRLHPRVDFPTFGKPGKE